MLDEINWNINNHKDEIKHIDVYEERCGSFWDRFGLSALSMWRTWKINYASAGDCMLFCIVSKVRLAGTSWLMKYRKKDDLDTRRSSSASRHAFTSEYVACFFQWTDSRKIYIYHCFYPEGQAILADFPSISSLYGNRHWNAPLTRTLMWAI